jgi:glycosyltransferase involved in cell wall biosynthesis
MANISKNRQNEYYIIFSGVFELIESSSSGSLITGSAYEGAPAGIDAEPGVRKKSCKLIIQIPCLNEEKTLPLTLSELPRKLPDVDAVEWLVIDDGSSDRTAEVARQLGADHVIRLPGRQGLAAAFSAGLDACLAAGADIIVNTDGDNQYRAGDIGRLIQPILDGRAQIVIGARPIEQIRYFSFLKRKLQRLGSWVVRTVSGVTVPDATSGFRAISREAALRINILTSYTYTLEMIIQAGQKGIPTISVPVRVNEPLRPSRLVKNVPNYVAKSAGTIIRIFITYRPLRFFLMTSVVPLALGLVLSARWVYLNIFEYPITGRTHVPSLVVAAVLLLTGVLILALGVLADLLAVNRMLLEDSRLRGRIEQFGIRGHGKVTEELSKPAKAQG